MILSETSTLYDSEGVGKLQTGRQISAEDVVPSCLIKLCRLTAAILSVGQGYLLSSFCYRQRTGKELEIRLVRNMQLCGVEIANSFSTEDADPETTSNCALEKSFHSSGDCLVTVLVRFGSMQLLLF